MSKLLTLVEVADYLQVTTRHLQDLRKLSCFPDPIVLGKATVRYREIDIDAFIENGGCQDSF